MDYGPCHFSSLVSYGINGLKGNAGSCSAWNLLIWASTSWRLWVITFIISIICAICKLWIVSRLRGPGQRWVGGSERPLPETTSTASAGCVRTTSNLHGAMGANKAGPVFRPSAAACEPLPLAPPPSKAAMAVACNCNCCCPPWQPAAPSVPPPTCVVSTGLAALRFFSGGPPASSSRMRG